jgi:hypothetical protein
MPLNYCSIGFTEEENKMLQDAELAIEKAGAWEYMKMEPADGGGFMFSDDDELKAIYQHIQYDGHSGSSMGWTMRQMQKLAILGGDEFCAQKSGMRIGPEVIAPPKTPRTPEMDTKVLNEYKNVKPFKRVPKWASDYATLYPQLVATLKFE